MHMLTVGTVKKETIDAKETMVTLGKSSNKYVYLQCVHGVYLQNWKCNLCQRGYGISIF